MRFERAILAALLAPLVVVPALPFLMFLQSLIIRYEEFDLRFSLLAVYVALHFAYLGMLVFAPAMYLLLTLIYRRVGLSVFTAGMTGFIAALTIPYIISLLDSPVNAWSNFRWLFAQPFRLTEWVNYVSLTGIVVGVTFWWICTPSASLARHR